MSSSAHKLGHLVQLHENRSIPFISRAALAMINYAVLIFEREKLSNVNEPHPQGDGPERCLQNLPTQRGAYHSNCNCQPIDVHFKVLGHVVGRASNPDRKELKIITFHADLDELLIFQVKSQLSRFAPAILPSNYTTFLHHSHDCGSASSQQSFTISQ